MHENDGRSILSMLQKLGKNQIFSYVKLKVYWSQISKKHLDVNPNVFKQQI